MRGREEEEPRPHRSNDRRSPCESCDASYRARRLGNIGAVPNGSSVLVLHFVVVVEGPNRNEELQLFFETDLGPGWKTFLQPTPRSSQTIGGAINTATGKFDSAATRRLESATNAAFQSFQTDTDDDLVEESYHFERLPLDLEVALSDGKRLRILGVHLKSKAISMHTNGVAGGRCPKATGARSSRRRCRSGGGSSNRFSPLQPQRRSR
jgi:hypothetical protein